MMAARDAVNKPKFPTDGARIEWTASRVDYVRYCAEILEMTAREIAADIGLEEGAHPRIFELCKRKKIDLKGTGPKRSRREMFIPVAPERLGVLRALARQHGRTPKDMARLIIDTALSEGAGFCNNILDLGE